MLELMRFDILLYCALASLILAYVILMVRIFIAEMEGLCMCAGMAACALVRAVVELCIDAVRNWMQSKRINRTDYGKIVSQKLASGKYKVVGGVFSSDNRHRAATTWDNVELDNELKWKLEAGKGTAIVNLA